MSPVFDDPKLITDYERGRYPPIHDRIYSFAARFAERPAVFADFGACTGLLAHRLLTWWGNEALAVEPHRVGQVNHARLTWLEIPIGPRSIFELRDMLWAMKVTTVVARRVFPEIDLASPGFVAGELASTLRDVGVDQIVLQGRVPVKGATATLPSLEAELEALCSSSSGRPPLFKPKLVSSDVALVVKA